MTRKLLALALVLAAVVLLAPQSAMAQFGVYMGRADNPVGPTVSPYLNLINSGVGGVTNYQSLVQPLVNQGAAIDRQGSQLRGVQRQLSQQPAAALGGPGSGAPTGRASFFMNYSHFYPSATGR